jgi:hypothetical protein
MSRSELICERLKKFGYVSERRIRLYGEELQLISDPIADAAGYGVVALTVRTGHLRHVRLPLSIVRRFERELDREAAVELAA